MSKWIQLSESYNRSTHLELDFKDSERLKNIYVSSKFQTGLSEILASVLEENSKHRVRVLSGSPGLGKSTFALFMAQALSKKHPKIIGELLKKSNQKLKKSFNHFQKSRKTKLLPIFINGYEGEIEKIFKSKLRMALKDSKISCKIKTQETLPFYQEVLKQLQKKGYGGVFVIYDEFGKYLERGVHNPTELNIQFLQNFAEFCDRSGSRQCHLMLITHLSISQYACQLPINVQQEWAKIEGRFQDSAFYDKSSDYYKMISEVFKKNISKTNPKMARKHKTYIKKYVSGFKEEALEDFINLKNIKDVLLDCFPLHPVTLALLPYLSMKVAQNERTLYTFLTRDENYSFKRFLDECFENEKTLVMPYDLYQYFKLLIGKDVGVGGSYKIQLMAEEAFHQINKKDDVSKQIISLMALCSVIKDSHFTPLTEKFIVSCFNQSYSEPEIKKSLKHLREKRVIFYNKNTKQFLLQEGTPIDIDEEISKLKIKTLTGKNLVQILKRYFKPDFIIPKKYNFDQAITRFYRTQMISVEELRSLRASKIIDFYKEDGVVFYVIPFSYDELNYAQSEIKKIVHPLVVFVLPKRFIECKKDIEELNAVDYLYNNKEVLSASPLVKKELDRHKEILLASINTLLKPLIGYMGLSAEAFYPKEASAKEVFHFKELQRFLGDLFKKEYSKYVGFNLEYVNRHNVSGSVTLGRKKFVDLLLWHKEEPQKSFDFLLKGRGPDYAIFQTMLRLSQFKYNESEKVYQISNKSAYYKFFKEYESILSKYPQEGASAQTLLNTLTAPPYGLRLGVIPLFTALSDLCFKQPISHYLDSAYVKNLDGSHYDLLMKYPKKTIIHYTPIDSKQQKFLDGLKEIFKSQDASIPAVVESLIRWRNTIPESTKLSSELSQEGRKFLIHIDSSKEPDNLLFRHTPDCFNKKEIDTKRTLQDITDTLSFVKKVKSEIDQVYKKLLLRIQNDIVLFSNFVNEHCLSHFLKQKVTEKSVIEDSQKILKEVKDYPFSSNTSRFIGRALNFDSSNYKQYFLETLADVLTGASPRNWDNKGYSKFLFALKKVKTEIELACEIANPRFKGESVLAFIDKGDNKKTLLKLGLSSSLDEKALHSLEKIKILLGSFDEIDKKKIILALLKSINEGPEAQNQNIHPETFGKESETNV